jgi:hypothetical protein
MADTYPARSAAAPPRARCCHHYGAPGGSGTATRPGRERPESTPERRRGRPVHPQNDRGCTMPSRTVPAFRHEVEAHTSTVPEPELPPRGRLLTQTRALSNAATARTCAHLQSTGPGHVADEFHHLSTAGPDDPNRAGSAHRTAPRSPTRFPSSDGPGSESDGQTLVWAEDADRRRAARPGHAALVGHCDRRRSPRSDARLVPPVQADGANGSVL